MKEQKTNDYRKECIAAIDEQSGGRHIIQLASGLDEEYIISRIARRGRMMIISHREDATVRFAAYFPEVGYEIAEETSDGEDIVLASVKSLATSRRYTKFRKDEFDIIIIDEAQHVAARSYREVIEYFTPRKLLGFTATPMRGNGARLDKYFDDIIFKRDIKWGIEHGHLTKTVCIRESINYDLHSVDIQGSDYNVESLDRAMRRTDSQLRSIYMRRAKGATIIYAVSVAQAERLAAIIPNAKAITYRTKNKAEIIDEFESGRINCLINYRVLTDGMDLPVCETIIVARPTKSLPLYTQMVSKGMRRHPGKMKLRIIDVTDSGRKENACTAANLVGYSIATLTKEQQAKVQGELLNLPKTITHLSESPASWIKSSEHIREWAKENRYRLRGINWMQKPDGSLTLHIPKNESANRHFDKDFLLPSPDALGTTVIGGYKIPFQEAIDTVYRILTKQCMDCKKLWDTETARETWGTGKITSKQFSMIERLRKSNPDIDFSGIDMRKLSRFEAALIINRIIDRENADNKNVRRWVNKDLIRQIQINQQSKEAKSEEKDARSISSYILWRYPKLNRYGSERVKRNIDRVFGELPGDLLNADEVYGNLLRHECHRVSDKLYKGENPYEFDSALGEITILFDLLDYMYISYKNNQPLQAGVQAVELLLTIKRKKLTAAEKAQIKQQLSQYTSVAHEMSAKLKEGG